jgi:preprotein translocase subunit SecA
VPAESVEEQWDLPALEKVLAEEWQIEVPLARPRSRSERHHRRGHRREGGGGANEAFEAKVALVGGEQFTPFERMVLLQSIDTHWREHLAALDYLRQGIHLRGYAQKNPSRNTSARPSSCSASCWTW